LEDGKVAVVVDRHGLSVFLDGPCEWYHDLETGKRDSRHSHPPRLGGGLGGIWRPCRKDLEKVETDYVRFG